MVRTGAAEAVVEGRFVIDEREVVLSRAVPRRVVRAPMSTGTWHRCRRCPRSVTSSSTCTASTCTSPCCARQHNATPSTVSPAPISAGSRARRELALIDSHVAGLGGDARELARTLDLLRFQLGEISSAAISSPGEADSSPGRSRCFRRSEPCASPSPRRRGSGGNRGVQSGPSWCKRLVGRAAAAFRPTRSSPISPWS